MHAPGCGAGGSLRPADAAAAGARVYGRGGRPVCTLVVAVIGARGRAPEGYLNDGDTNWRVQMWRGGFRARGPHGGACGLTETVHMRDASLELKQISRHTAISASEPPGI